MTESGRPAQKHAKTQPGVAGQWTAPLCCIRAKQSAQTPCNLAPFCPKHPCLGSKGWTGGRGHGAVLDGCLLQSCCPWQPVQKPAHSSSVDPTYGSYAETEVCWKKIIIDAIGNCQTCSLTDRLSIQGVLAGVGGQGLGCKTHLGHSPSEAVLLLKCLVLTHWDLQTPPGLV